MDDIKCRQPATGIASRVQSNKQGLWIHPIQSSRMGWLPGKPGGRQIILTSCIHKNYGNSSHDINGIDSLLLSKWVSIDACAARAAQVGETYYRQQKRRSCWIGTNESVGGWIDVDGMSVPLKALEFTLMSLLTGYTDYITDSKHNFRYVRRYLLCTILMYYNSCRQTSRDTNSQMSYRTITTGNLV